MSFQIFFSHKFSILISSSEVKQLFTDIHYTRQRGLLKTKMTITERKGPQGKKWTEPL